MKLGDLMLPFLERIFNRKIKDSPIGVGFAHKDVKRERTTDYVYEDNKEWDPEPRPKGDE